MCKLIWIKMKCFSSKIQNSRQLFVFLSFKSTNSGVNSLFNVNNVFMWYQIYVLNFTLHVSYVFSNLDAFSRIIKFCEEKHETDEKKKGKKGNSVTSVKGITNLGNTCFFNAVMQVRGIQKLCKMSKIILIHLYLYTCSLSNDY